ncbi:hypothetical protein AB3N04_00295 (plasmid) [Alkalihalophilus sp. As8PL]|uniref:Uncharacterized protein n=1 Tax=Alkalihalophilus sp. As8PL TaxID=3237103 RepID=A0AB39BP36_9BACI
MNNNARGRIVDTETNEELLLDVVTTSQLVKVERDELGNEYKEYIVDSFMVSEETSQENEPMVGILNSYVDGKNEWDNSYSVYGRSSFTIRERLVNTKPHYYLTRVEGSWSIQDSQIRISNQRIRYGQEGFVSGGYRDRLVGSSNIIGTTFGFNLTASSWSTKAVQIDNLYTIGMYMYCRVTNSSTGRSWDFHLDNWRGDSRL